MLQRLAITNYPKVDAVTTAIKKAGASNVRMTRQYPRKAKGYREVLLEATVPFKDPKGSLAEHRAEAKAWVAEFLKSYKEKDLVEHEHYSVFSDGGPYFIFDTTFRVALPN